MADLANRGWDHAGDPDRLGLHKERGGVGGSRQEVAAPARRLRWTRGNGFPDKRPLAYRRRHHARRGHVTGRGRYDLFGTTGRDEDDKGEKNCRPGKQAHWLAQTIRAIQSTSFMAIVRFL